MIFSQMIMYERHTLDYKLKSKKLLTSVFLLSENPLKKSDQRSINILGVTKLFCLQKGRRDFKLSRRAEHEA